MLAKVILANPERGLYAAHVKTHDRVAVFELRNGPPLRIGDIIRGIFSYIGEVEVSGQGEAEIYRITIIKTGVSPMAATVCLYGLTDEE